MAIDKNKINDNALKLIQKGQVKKAIREYEKILSEDPNEVRTLLKKGDLHTRIGEKDQAIETYLKVAASYSQQGFHLKAVAVFKQILKIDESRIDVNLSLANEYQKLGIVGDAIANLQKVAFYYDQQGSVRESISLFRRMVDLDPDNIASRIKMAELFSREGMVKDAVSEFERAAQDLKSANRVEDYIRVCERLIYHDSSNFGLIKELANIYLQRGDAKRALSKLQICFKVNPRDLEILSMLAMSFQELNQLPKTVSVYKEIAKIYQEQGALTEMQQVYRRVLEIAPNDPETRQALANAGVALPVPAAKAAMLAAPGHRSVMPSQPRPSPAPSAPEQTKETMSRLLTEMDVYIKYGLQSKALEHLSRIFQLDPSNIEAHEKLTEIYISSNQMDHAAQELVTLAQLTSRLGRFDQARAYLRSLFAIFPNHPKGMALAQQLGGGVGAYGPAAAPRVMMDNRADIEGAMAEGIDIDIVEELPIDVDMDGLAAEEMAEGVDILGPAEGSELLNLMEESEGVGTLENAEMELGEEQELIDFHAEEDFFKAGKQPRRARPPSPPVSVSSKLLDEESLDEEFDAADMATLVGRRPPSATGRGAALEETLDLPDESFDTNELTPTVGREASSLQLPAKAEARQKARAEKEPAQEELTDALEEVDFFIQQNLLDEAVSELQRLKKSHPDHRGLLERIAKVERLQQGETAMPQVSLEEVERPFDLASEIEKEVGKDSAPLPLDEDFQYSFDDVFSEFKKGVEKLVGKEDSATHFDLGIAYKEMGLTDDAINEFMIAAQDDGRKASALTMVGLCYVDKGQYSEAINRFKEGLHGKNISDREETGLYYEMGQTYELLKDPGEALFYFNKVQKRDARFRDVAAKVKVLKEAGVTSKKGEDDEDQSTKSKPAKDKISYM